MTITQNVASKLVVGFVVASMLFTLSFTPAKAQVTASALQTQITTLLAQIASLQGTTTAAPTGGACVASFMVNLKVGSTGADVKKLQAFLNRDVETRVAAAGAGSIGAETMTFGPMTAAAVSKFQIKYRAEVLTPGGLVSPTGFFGPSSRAKANMLCSSAVPTVTTSTVIPRRTSTTTPVVAGLEGGEAILSNYQLRDGDDTELEEGQKNGKIADMEFKVRGGDIEVNRVELAFDPASGNAELDPWATFDTVSVFADGKMVGDIDASDEDNWDLVSGDIYKIRITGIDAVVREDDTAELTIAVTVQSGTDITSTDTWVMYSTADGVRTLDADGIDQYVGSTGETISFTVAEKGTDDELTIKSASENPPATVLAVDLTSTSGWTTILAYTLDTDDSVNDIGIRVLPIQVSVPGEVYNQVVNSSRIMVGTKTFTVDSNVTPAAAMNIATFNFDKDEWDIDAGSKVVVKFQVKFNGLTGNYPEGQTIFASTTDADNMTAKGADTLVVSQKSGSAQGKTHTLRSAGVVLTAATKTTPTLNAKVDTTTVDDEGVFVVTFKVKAFENDIWVNKTAASGTSMSTLGINFLVTDGSGNLAGTTTPTASLSSTAETDGARFKVNQGEEKTFTLTVNYDPGLTGFYGVAVHSLNFATTNADPTTQQTADPRSDYETNPLNISN